MAAPAAGPILPARLKPPVELPASMAMMDDFYSAGAGAPLVIFIQDAHTNPSGQINIARALDRILASRPVSTVYLEAGKGDVSLTGFRSSAPAETRRNVGLSYLKKGLLQGSEFLSLTSDRDFTLWGVENRALYERSIRLYGEVVKLRPSALAALSRITRAYEAVRDARYGPALAEWDETMRRHELGEMPLVDYAAKISARLTSIGGGDSLYPNLKALTKIQHKELSIDLVLAQKELRMLALDAKETAADPVDRLLIEDYLSGAGPEDERINAVCDALFDLWKRRSKESTDTKKNLKNAGAYLKQRIRVRELAAAGLLSEIRSAQTTIANALAVTDEERRLIEIGGALKAMRSAIELKMDPETSSMFADAPARSSSQGVMGYLNRQILELGKFYEKAPLRNAKLEKALKLSVHFYELAARRDRTFLGLMRRRMELRGEKQAVLITGGYHSAHLKDIFREYGISYVSFIPCVSHETDGVRYEKLLLGRENGRREGGGKIAVGQTAISPLQVRAAGNGTVAARLAREFGLDPAAGVPQAPGERSKEDRPAGARMSYERMDNAQLAAEARRVLDSYRGIRAFYGYQRGIEEDLAAYNDMVEQRSKYMSREDARISNFALRNHLIGLLRGWDSKKGSTQPINTPTASQAFVIQEAESRRLALEAVASEARELIHELDPGLRLSDRFVPIFWNFMAVTHPSLLANSAPPLSQSDLRGFWYQFKQNVFSSHEFEENYRPLFNTIRRYNDLQAGAGPVDSERLLVQHGLLSPELAAVLADAKLETPVGHGWIEELVARDAAWAGRFFESIMPRVDSVSAEELSRIRDFMKIPKSVMTELAKPRGARMAEPNGDEKPDFRIKSRTPTVRISVPDATAELIRIIALLKGSDPMNFNRFKWDAGIEKRYRMLMDSMKLSVRWESDRTMGRHAKLKQEKEMLMREREKLEADLDRRIGAESSDLFTKSDQPEETLKKLRTVNSRIAVLQLTIAGMFLDPKPQHGIRGIQRPTIQSAGFAQSLRGAVSSLAKLQMIRTAAEATGFVEEPLMPASSADKAAEDRGASGPVKHAQFQWLKLGSTLNRLRIAVRRAARDPQNVQEVESVTSQLEQIAAEADHSTADRIRQLIDAANMAVEPAAPTEALGSFERSHEEVLAQTDAVVLDRRYRTLVTRTYKDRAAFERGLTQRIPVDVASQALKLNGWILLVRSLGVMLASRAKLNRYEINYVQKSVEAIRDWGARGMVPERRAVHESAETLLKALEDGSWTTSGGAAFAPLENVLEAMLRRHEEQSDIRTRVRARAERLQKPEGARMTTFTANTARLDRYFAEAPTTLLTENEIWLYVDSSALYAPLRQALSTAARSTGGEAADLPEDFNKYGLIKKISTGPRPGVFRVLLDPQAKTGSTDLSVWTENIGASDWDRDRHWARLKKPSVNEGPWIQSGESSHALPKISHLAFYDSTVDQSRSGDEYLIRQESHPEELRILEQTAHWIQKNTDRGEAIFLAAEGPGSLALPLIRKGVQPSRLILNDRSVSMLNLARERMEGAGAVAADDQFRVGNVLDPAVWPDQPLGLVSDSLFINFLSAEERKSYWKLAREHLSEDGKLLTVVRSIDLMDARGLLDGAARRDPRDYEDAHDRVIQDFILEMTNAGWDVRLDPATIRVQPDDGELYTQNILAVISAVPAAVPAGARMAKNRFKPKPWEVRLRTWLKRMAWIVPVLLVGWLLTREWSPEKDKTRKSGTEQVLDWKRLKDTDRSAVPEDFDARKFQIDRMEMAALLVRLERDPAVLAKFLQEDLVKWEEAWLFFEATEMLRDPRVQELAKSLRAKVTAAHPGTLLAALAGYHERTFTIDEIPQPDRVFPEMQPFYTLWNGGDALAGVPISGSPEARKFAGYLLRSRLSARNHNIASTTIGSASFGRLHKFSEQDRIRIWVSYFAAMMSGEEHGRLQNYMDWTKRWAPEASIDPRLAALSELPAPVDTSASGRFESALFSFRALSALSGKDVQDDPIAGYYLREGLEKSALQIVRHINDLHGRPDEVRFAAVSDFSPRELFHLIASADAELYTSSYHRLLDRLLVRSRNAGISIEELLDESQWLGGSSFMALAAGFGRMGDVLDSYRVSGPVNTDKQRFSSEIALRLMGHLDGTSDGLGRAGVIARIFESPDQARLMPILVEKLKLGYASAEAGGDRSAMTVQGLLAGIAQKNMNSQDPWLIQMAEKYPAREITVTSGEAFFGQNGTHHVSTYFPTDDDGKASYTHFKKFYGSKPGWKVEEIKKSKSEPATHILIRSPKIKGRQIILVANNPNSSDGSDARDEYLQSHVSTKERISFFLRGHSFNRGDNLQDVMKGLAAWTRSAPLVFSGDCGGAKSRSGKGELFPAAYHEGTVDTGTMNMNERLSYDIFETALRENGIRWNNFFLKADKRYADVKEYDGYRPARQTLTRFISSYHAAMSQPSGARMAEKPSAPKHGKSDEIIDFEYRFKIGPGTKKKQLLLMLDDLTESLRRQAGGQVSLNDPGLDLRIKASDIGIYDVRPGRREPVKVLSLNEAISNSIDAIADEADRRGEVYEGRIRLAVAQDEGSLTVLLDDNGAGFEEAALKKFYVSELGKKNTTKPDSRLAERIGGAGVASFLFFVLARERRGAVQVDSKRHDATALKAIWDFAGTDLETFEASDRSSTGTMIQWAVPFAAARMAKDSRWTDRIPPRRVKAYRRMAMQIADRIEKDNPIALLIDAPSGLGKTTLATAVEEELRSRGLDSSRIGLDLFMHSDEVRKQNNARILAKGEARTDEYRRVWRTRVLDRFFDQLFEYLASKPASRDHDQKSIRVKKAFIRDYKELDPDWKALNPDVPTGIHKAFAPLTIPLKRDLKIIEGKFAGNIKALSRYSDRVLYVRMDGGAYRAKVQFLQRYRKTMTPAELKDRAKLHDLYTGPSYFTDYEPATRKLVDLFAQVTDPKAENWTVREPASTGSAAASKQLFAAAAARMAADRRQRFLFRDGGSGLITAIAVIAWAPTFAVLTVLSVLGSDWARRRWLGADMPGWYRRGITAFMIILSTVPGLPRGISPIIVRPISEDRAPAQPALPARRRADETDHTVVAGPRTDLVESATAYGEMVEEHVGHNLSSNAVMLTNHSQLLLADELGLGPSDKVLSYYPDADVSFGAFMLGAALRGATADVAQVETGIDYMQLWPMIRFYLEDLTRQKYSDDLWKGVEARLRILPTNDWRVDEPTWTERIGGPYTHVYLPLMPPYVNNLDKILASLADEATLIVVGEGGSWNPEFAWRRTLFEINERHPETVYELIPEGRTVLTYGVLHLHNEAFLFKIHRKRPADYEQMGLPDAEAVKELRQMEFMVQAREQKLKWNWTEIPAVRENEDHFEVGNTVFIRKQTGGSVASIERSDDRRVIWFTDVPNARDRFIVNGVNTMLALKTLDETIHKMNGSAFTAVDVGAGAGALTLLLADNDLSRRVYAVEPDRTALEMLQDNLFANHIRYEVVENAEQFLRAVKDPDHHVIVVAGTVGDFHQWVDRADPGLVFPSDTETLYTANMPRGTLNAVLPQLKTRLFGTKSGPLSAQGIWLHLTGIEQHANIESAAVFVSDGDIEGAIQQQYPAQWLEKYFDDDDLEKQGWQQRIAKRSLGQSWDVLAALIHRPAETVVPSAARMAELSGEALAEFGARLVEAQPAAVANGAAEFAVEFAPEQTTWLEVWRDEGGLKIKVFGEVHSITPSTTRQRAASTASEKPTAALVSAEEWAELQRIVMEAAQKKLDLRYLPDALERGGVVLHLDGLAGIGALQQSRLRALALEAAHSNKDTQIVLEGDEALRRSFREIYLEAKGATAILDLSEIPAAEAAGFSHVLSRSAWNGLADKVSRPVILEDIKEESGKVTVHVFGPVLREAEALSRIKSIDARDGGLQQIFDFHRSLMGSTDGTFLDYVAFLEGKGNANLFTLPAIARVGVSEAVRLFALAARLSRQSA